MPSLLVLVLLLGAAPPPPPLLEEKPLEDPAQNKQEAEQETENETNVTNEKGDKSDSSQPDDERAPRARRKRLPATVEPLENDGTLPPAEPIQDLFQADLQTMALHGALNCGFAAVTFPLSCTPCLGVCFYPLAVGFGTSMIGRALDDEARSNILVPTIVFGIVEMTMIVFGIALYFALFVLAAAIASSMPGLASFLSPGPGAPPFILIIVYGVGPGYLASTVALAVMAATGSWYIAGRDDQGRGVVNSFLPFLYNEEPPDDDWAYQRPPHYEAWQKKSRPRRTKHRASGLDPGSTSTRHLMAF